MKRHSIFHFLLSLTLFLSTVACEKNDIIPDYELVGTSTATIAEIALPNDTLAPGEEVVVTLYYVNLDEDPAASIQLLEQIGSADFSEVTMLDESSAPLDEEITRSYTYTVPQADDGTDITLDMVLTSQRAFPQRERTSFVVFSPPE